MKIHHKLFVCFLAAVPSFAIGQILFDGTAYTQNFNSLTFANNISTSWTNNDTLTGWYLNSHGQGDATDYRGRYPGGASLIDNTFGLYNNALDLGNYSMGLRTAAAMGQWGIVGMRLENATGSTLTSFDLAYQASQYYQSAQQFMRVEYSLDAVSVQDGGATWNVLSDLTYNAPFTGSNAIITDQQQQDSRSNLSMSGQTIVWNASEDLWIRFISYRDAPDNSYTGSSAVLTVNDVSFTAIPEPSTYAVLFGLATLALALLRRRLK